MSSLSAAAAAASTRARDTGVLHPVFISTSIGTNLVLNVSDSDTASDFQKKLGSVHRELYPAVGEVEVKGLKVKEGGTFYDVEGSISVKSLFEATRWVMSVDLEQTDGAQHSGKDKAGDQLALQWVTRSRSVERLDDHGSLSTRSKIVPFVNQKDLNASQLTSGDSCKDISKNVEEDVAGNDKQLDNEPQEKLDTVNTDTDVKKRARYVGKVSSPKDDFGSGLSLKKKRKTWVKSNAQTSEENISLPFDNGKVNDKGASMNNENFLEQKSKGKSEKEKDSELVQKPAMENEKIYALINVGSNSEERASDQIDTRKDDLEISLEHRPEAKLLERKKGTTVRESIVEGKRGKVRKSAVKKKDDSLFKPSNDLAGDVPSTVYASVIDERKTNEVSENTLGDANKGDDVTVKDVEISVENIEGKSGKELTNTNDVATQTNVENLLPLSEGLMNNGVDKFETHKVEMDVKKKPIKKKKTRKTAAANEDVSIKKNVSGNVCEDVNTLAGDVSSTVLASFIDERRVNEVSENTLKNANKADDVIVKEVEIREENVEETSRKEFADINDAATVANDENLLPHSESVVNNDADSLEKQTEKVDDMKKQKKKKKTRKSAGRNEDKLITMHVNGDVSGDVFVKVVENSVEKEEEKSGKEFKDANDVKTVPKEERRMNGVSQNTLKDAIANKADDVIVKEVEITEDNVEEASSKEFTDTNDAATVAIEKNLLPHFESLVNNADSLEKQNEKVNDTKKQKKKRKTRKSAGRNEDELITKHVNGDVSDDVVVKMVENSVYKVEKKSGKEFKDANDVETITNEENLLPNLEGTMSNDAANLEKQNEKMNDTEKPKPRLKRKSRKVPLRNEEPMNFPDSDRKDGGRMKEKDAEIGHESLVEKANKNIESQDLLSKHQSTEVQLDKSQSVDRHHLPEEALKDTTVSEVPKINHEADATAAANNKKDMKKTKDDSKNENKVSMDVLKDPHITNIGNIKAPPKRAKKIDVQTTNKQQAILGQTRAKTVKKQSVNSSQQAKSLLNAPASIFGDDSDNDETVNAGAKTMKKKNVNNSGHVKSLLNVPASIFEDDSDNDESVNSGFSSSTRTPSPSSSSSSSSGSVRKGKEDGKKSIIHQLSKLKNMSVADRLRSSSSFKKAKLTALSQVEDTESQPVDFVPESQL